MSHQPGGFKTTDFGDEDFRIVVNSSNIIIAGGRPEELYMVFIHSLKIILV